MAAARLWAAYELALEVNPLKTNMANTAILFAIGDIIGQSSTILKDKTGKVKADFTRWLRAVAYGLIYCLPAHVHYGFIERLAQRVVRVGIRAANSWGPGGPTGRPRTPGMENPLQWTLSR